MMRMRTKASPAAFVSAKESFAAAVAAEEEEEENLEWEMKPCGMLVQKRNRNEAAAALAAPTIRVRVKYNSVYYDVYVSSQATFGELKKLMAERTGLHPQDQKVLYKDKERDSAAFLDMSGVKDRSKMVILEDPAAQAKRCLELRRNAKMEKASKSISQISIEVDKLASQVSSLEAIVSKGGKVAEKELLNLTELLMNQLIKLDEIIADGDAKQMRRMQVRRVQKYVETLDMLKIKNAMPKSNGHVAATHQEQQQQQKPQNQQRQQQQRQTTPPPVVVTTKWEVFDSLFSPTASRATSSTSTSTTTASSSAPTPRFDWELF